MDTDKQHALDEKLHNLIRKDLNKSDDYETDLKIYKAFENELGLDSNYPDNDSLGEIEWM